MLPDVRTMAKKFYGERRADLKFASVFVCYEPLLFEPGWPVRCNSNSGRQSLATGPGQSRRRHP